MSVVRPEAGSDNPLWQYFQANTKRTIDKWHHYFDIYHNHFQRFRNKPVTILEIGVYKGGSLQMWKEYFGPDAKIIGMDINPECLTMTEEQITVVIGDQANRETLRRIAKTHGPFDIVLDDGGHTMVQQITSYEELFPHVKENGVYLVEDLHTSYWKDYGGGYKRPTSFIEYSKNFIDQLNARHTGGQISPSDFTHSVTGLHFYDSVLVIEKYPNISVTSSRKGNDL